MCVGGCVFGDVFGVGAEPGAEDDEVGGVMGGWSVEGYLGDDGDEGWCCGGGHGVQCGCTYETIWREVFVFSEGLPPLYARSATAFCGCLTPHPALLGPWPNTSPRSLTMKPAMRSSSYKYMAYKTSVSDTAVLLSCLIIVH